MQLKIFIILCTTLICTCQDNAIIHLLSWGSNAHGSLGEGTTYDRIIPGFVDNKIFFTSPSIKYISSGEDYSVALTEDGKVFLWGKNSEGVVGDGTTINRVRPVSVFSIDVLRNKSVTQISAGVDHVLAITHDGKLVAWGRSEYGKLGDRIQVRNRCFPWPVYAKGELESAGALMVASGAGHSVVVSKKHQIFVWGERKAGALGSRCNVTEQSYDCEPASTPRLLEDVLVGKQFKQIEAGNRFTMALTTDGEVFWWGQDHGKNSSYLELPVHAFRPTLLPGLKDQKIVKLAVGHEHAIFLSNNGKLFGWGNNNDKQLCTSQLERTSVAVPITTNIPIEDVAAGFFHTFLVSPTDIGNQLYACGKNDKGQLGDGTLITRDHPVLINSTEMVGAKIRLVSGGNYHSIVGISYSCRDVADCSSHGRCLFTNVCACYTGYTGSKCELVICHGKNSSDPDVCSQRGTCDIPDKCTCKYGFSGDNCDICDGVVINGVCSYNWTTAVVIIVCSIAFVIGLSIAFSIFFGVLIALRKYPKCRMWKGYRLIREEELQDMVIGDDIIVTESYESK